jgi:glycosyltransferase involved in cell wall biosynthesis
VKIAYLYDFKAFPPKGGNHLHAFQLIRQFQAAGLQVLTWGDDSVSGVTSYARDAAGAEAIEQAADLLYVRVDGNEVGRDALLSQLLFRTALPMVWELNSPANENLAFSYLGGRTGSVPALLAPALALKRRVHAWRQLPGIWKEDRLRRVLAPKVFGAICVSSGVARYASEGLGIARVAMVPNGADPDTQRPDGPIATLPAEFAGNLTVLYAGSPIYPWQGLGMLRDTIGLCAAANDPVRFVLLLNQPAPGITASSRVSVHVGVPHREVGNYLRAVDVGVYLHPEFWWSRWGNHGSPMKLFEYMAFGRPVVASNVGQLAEIVSNGVNGFLCENDPADLRRALLEAAAQRERLPEMGRVARRAVEERYNWSEVARRTIEMFEAAVGDSRRRA